jgi:hypothetical protein
MYLHDPADADVLQSAKSGLTATTWTAFKGYGSFQVAAMFKEGTSMILLAIYAAESAAGANATEIKTSGAILCDAEGDWAMQECTAEEVNAAGKAAGYDFTHVAARLTLQNAADECVVVYILDEPLFKYVGLTPASTIA